MANCCLYIIDLTYVMTILDGKSCPSVVVPLALHTPDVWEQSPTKIAATSPMYGSLHILSRRSRFGIAQPQQMAFQPRLSSERIVRQNNRLQRPKAHAATDCRVSVFGHAPTLERGRPEWPVADGPLLAPNREQRTSSAA